VVSDFVYVATTYGCLVVIDSHSLTVCAVAQPNRHVTVIIPLTTDQSQPADWSHNRHRLMTIGRGYADLVGRTVSQYRGSEVSSCEGDVLLVWSDADWLTPT